MINILNIVKKKMIFFFILIISIYIYNKYNKNLNLIKDSFYYYKISYFINKSDFKSTKKYAKKIFIKNNKNIYYDISCFILYKLSYKKKIYL